MKSMIQPVEFVVPLSEVEVRMTLRELCGSRFDNYPFKGEVEKNSFRLIKNTFENTKGIAKPIFVGSFIEQNGKTKVRISVEKSVLDSISTMVLGLAVLCFATFGFVSTLDGGLIMAITSFVAIVSPAVIGFALGYFLIWLQFQRAVTKIRRALGDSNK